MINEMRFVRKKHYDYELAKVLFSKLEEKQLLALVGGAYLNYVYKCEHTEVEVAKYLNISKATYRHNKKTGYLMIQKSLEFKDQLDMLRTA